MLGQRIILGGLMIAALLAVIVFDGQLAGRTLAAYAAHPPAGGARALLWCGLPFTVLALALLVPAVYEFGRLCRTGGLQPAVHWAAFIVAGLLCVPWVQMQYRIDPTSTLTPIVPLDLPLSVLWLTGGLLGACLVILTRKTTQNAISSMAVTMLIVLYLGLLGSFAVRIRCLDPGPGGSARVVFFILAVKFSDIGAYFTGKLFGRNKLAPWLSPGKTIEGAVGAIILASLASAGGIALWNRLAYILGDAPLNYSQALIFGIVMAITGHLGDLVESAMKRDVGSKDSGRVLPAFGGLLDLLDSPLFAAPFAWWLLTFWS